MSLGASGTAAWVYKETAGRGWALDPQRKQKSPPFSGSYFGFSARFVFEERASLRRPEGSQGLSQGMTSRSPPNSNIL